MLLFASISTIRGYNMEVRKKVRDALTIGWMSSLPEPEATVASP